MWDRAVVHLNVADFAVAVERAMDPRLRGRPVIVAPQGAARAVVYDMSDEAYQCGVRKAMPLHRARRRCGDATLLHPHLDRYERAMSAFLERARPYTPLAEAVDESGHIFLDLSGTGKLFGSPPDVAWRIRKEVKEALGLDPIWSLAPNKLLAKVATRVVKPTGEYIVEPGEEEQFLEPLPVSYLPGVERDALRLLRELHLTRVGQVGRLSLEQLRVAVGSGARGLYESVRGIDPSPVLPAGERRPVVRQEHGFASDENDVALVQGGLFAMVERAGRELRVRRLAARRLGLVVDYADGSRVVRSASTRQATANDFRLFELARAALQRAWIRRVRLRHLRLTCDRLTFPPAQLELFAGPQEEERRQDNLVRALDRIRERFGESAVRLGRTLPGALHDAA